MDIIPQPAPDQANKPFAALEAQIASIECPHAAIQALLNLLLALIRSLVSSLGETVLPALQASVSQPPAAQGPGAAVIIRPRRPAANPLSPSAPARRPRQLAALRAPLRRTANPRPQTPLPGFPAAARPRPCAAKPRRGARARDAPQR